MSARLTNSSAKTPRNFGKSDKFDNDRSKNENEKNSYHYDVDLDQPDLTTFFKKEYNTCFKTDCPDNVPEEKTTPRNLETAKKMSEKHVPPDIKKIDETNRALSVCPKSEPIAVKKYEKSSTNKTARTSRIPRARFTAFSRLPLKNKTKKLSITKICTTKSKSAMTPEPQQVQKPIESKHQPENKIEHRDLSDQKITLVVSDSKSIFSEEKCSGIDADVELDPDHELTTSTDNSPGRINRIENPSISSILRASKLSCDCRSCSDEQNLELAKNRVNPEISTDSRSSPDVGRYSSSTGRNGLSNARRLSETSKFRGHLNETTEESDIQSTTDYSSYERETLKRLKKREKHSSIIPDPVGIVAKSNSAANQHTKIRSRSRMTFSFFDTLFDIVFWPFIFLRNDR